MCRRHRILQSGRNLQDDVREADGSKVHNRRKVAVDVVSWYGSQMHQGKDCSGSTAVRDQVAGQFQDAGKQVNGYTTNGETCADEGRLFR